MASGERAHRATVADMLMTLVSEPVLTPLQAIVLGAVQGLSELLPISSSAHLYLVPTLLGWPYAGGWTGCGG